MTTETTQSPSVEEIYARTVLDIGIPPRPTILDILARELRSGEPDFGRIAQCVSEDVSLSAGLIKTANSPFFGFRVRARTVSHALTMLGINIAGKAIAGVALRNAFPASPALERFWDASARIAEYSGHLVGLLGVREGIRSDDAYTFGLFRDCGMPVLMRKFPAYRDTLLRANANPDKRFTAIEDEDFPTNHAIVGCMLAQSWSLPEEICLAIRHHHDFLLMQSGAISLPPASRRLVALAQLAEYIHQQHSGMNQTEEWAKLGMASLSTLELGQVQLDELAAQVVAHSAQADIE
ncbi:HDOD domain-containing protein [Chitinimonas viridis]|uniref:HDOD domain-containing protein n=1 Tax=Chitinimonas viridis TaxID=664880 RepID=A0ABT8B3C6_9NEIS|nr:HDOD domain-containing protein [Chitinimonas viridis]MDN3576514.1 HDOD domain-containing protein [Chitinimonas viridis]